MTELDERTARRVAEAYRRPATPDPEARERLMAALGREPRPRRSRLAAWLLHPLEIRVVPLAGVAVAAALIAIGVWIGRGSRDALRVAAPAGPAAPTEIAWSAPGSPRVVQFVLVAPGAMRVALVGDFNGWDLNATPMHRARGSDAWTVDLPVPLGRHRYAFVADGSRWMIDPVAPLAPEDGFGIRSSVLVVGGPDAT